MPIAKLFIEGNLESTVLVPILQGNPVVLQGGSKNALRPRALTERRENDVAAGYLRDRDFDYDPPLDLSRPTVDYEKGGIPIGWRWCRHEIENYLIDPVVVTEAMGGSIPDVEGALRQAARMIRSYEAARWAIGIVRRALPPNYELRTRPDGLNEIELPAALDHAAVNGWAFNNIENHRRQIMDMTDPTAVQASIDDLAARFDDAFVTDVAMVLLWFSGKDILAAMSEWILNRGFPNPGAFRAALRDWIIANPSRILELLPEWNRMTEVVRA